MQTSVILRSEQDEKISAGVSIKGGGERWLKMASAMQSALEHMREMYVLLDHLRERHAEPDFCACSKHPGNWTPLLNEVTMVANILKIGLKAR